MNKDLFGLEKKLNKLEAALFGNKSKLNDIVQGDGAIVLHNTRLDVDKSVRISEILKKIAEVRSEVNNIEISPSFSQNKSVCMSITDSDEAVEVADGLIAFTVPFELNGYELIDVLCSVYEKGITGTTDIQIRRRRDGTSVDMLNAKISIKDEWFVRNGVVDIYSKDIVTGDQLFVDVDAVHTGTAPLGLSVVLTFGKI